jgi:protein-disulfide isomerase
MEDEIKLTQHHKAHSKKSAEDATPWKVATGVFALLFIVAILNTPLFSNTATQATQQMQQQGQTTADMKLYADDVIKGDANAKVTVILYSDPSCPFCAAAAGGSEMVAYMKSRSSDYEAAVPGIIKNYVDTGKVKLVFRFFPGHGNGEEAMKIMLCANEQEKFWQVHDAFFNAQTKLMNSGSVDVAGLKKLAVDNGVDSAKLETCLASKKYDSKLATDTQRGQAMQVQGTPGFFVNGVIVSGAQPYSALEQVINAALAK